MYVYRCNSFSDTKRGHILKVAGSRRRGTEENKRKWGRLFSQLEQEVFHIGLCCYTCVCDLHSRASGRRMALHICKRGAKYTSLLAEKMNSDIDDETKATMRGLPFRLLELPIHTIYDILSRLPLKTIFSCRCVCRAFLKILTDPYFAKIQLTKAPTTSASLIVQECSGSSRFNSMYMLDLDETMSTSSCSTDRHPRGRGPHHALTKQNVIFSFLNSETTLVGSCNGLLCLYSTKSQKPIYCICNPVLGEYMVLRHLTPSTSAYTYLNHSGFGFCPKTKEYKVIRFMCSTSLDPLMVVTSRTVAEIHTLGTESWRSIGDAQCPRNQGSLDPFLNGALHWITDSCKASDLLCSIDLETEQFRPVPSPAHFDASYVDKISWINIMLLGGCLSICYVFEDVQFMVWVMKEYGLRESWVKEFSIDIKFYCGLRGEDLHRPIIFLHSGDLLFICNSNSLVSFSPEKRTFRDFKSLGLGKTEVIAYIPSFLSLECAVMGKNLEVKKFKWETTLLL